MITVDRPAEGEGRCVQFPSWAQTYDSRVKKNSGTPHKQRLQIAGVLSNRYQYQTGTFGLKARLLECWQFSSDCPVR